MPSDGTIVESQRSDNAETGEPKAGSDRIIPIPASKVRKWTADARELAEIKSNSRQATYQERQTGVPINKEQQDALDLIGESVTHRVSTEFSSIQDQLDEMSLERGLDRVYSDPNSELYADEMQEELRRLMRENPKARVNELISRAETEAIAKAYRAGKLTDSIREEEAETARVKSTLSVPRQAATPRVSSEKPLDQMDAAELAASGRFDEYFAIKMGRPRRR